MPYTINGIGTRLYAADVGTREGSFDAAEWFVFLYAPLIPIRCVHTFNWSGNSYQFVPLRWSWAVVLRSFLYGWRSWLLFVGCLMFVVSGIGQVMAIAGCENTKPGDPVVFTIAAVFAGLGVLLLAVGGALHGVLHLTGNRARAIRRLLGRHQLGTADPAAMRDPPHVDPGQMFGDPTFADAVPRLLDAGDTAGAMWAARLATALEDPVEGERLTDEVLRSAT